MKFNRNDMIGFACSALAILLIVWLALDNLAQ